METIKQLTHIIDTLEKLNKNLLSDEVASELADAKKNLGELTPVQEKIESLLIRMRESNGNEIEKMSTLLGDMYFLFQNLTDSMDLSSLIRKLWTHYGKLLPKRVQLKESPLLIKIDKQVTLKDAYRLAIVKDYIIVNDAYRGLIVLDKQLKEVRKILIFPHLLIDEIFTHPNNNELVLYSSENKCFIWIDAESGNFVTINFSEKKIEYPKKVAVWENNTLFFGTRDTRFYTLDLSKKIIQNISVTSVKKRFPIFFEHIHYLNTYYPKATVLNRPIAIFNDEKRQEGTIVDIKTKTEVTFPYDNDFYCFAHYHDVYKHMVICEYSISFIDEKGFYMGLVEPEKYTDFLHTFYFEDNGFITLLYGYGEDTNRDTIVRIYRFE